MSTISIDVRRARVADSADISRVHDAAWRHAYTGLIPYKALDTMIRRRDEAWWARAIRQSTRILVLEDMDRVVGYATLGPNRVNALSHEGEIYELYLSPEYQGVGLGRKLFLAARQELTNIGLNGCVVWVLEENDPAIRFYSNAGGRDVAEGTETFSGKKLNKVAYCWS